MGSSEGTLMGTSDKGAPLFIETVWQQYYFKTKYAIFCELLPKICDIVQVIAKNYWEKIIA